jgi:arginine:agmatine antiporter
MVAGMMSAIVIFTVSPSASKQFGLISSISVIMTLLPYLYTAAALRLLGEPHFGKSHAFYHGCILVAVVYSAWAVVGSDAKQVLWSFVIVLLTSLFYAQMEGKHGQAPASSTAAAA